VQQTETATLRLARSYKALGWSVVPVRPGDKLPAVSWAKYEREPADDDALVDWFSVGGYGIGLVQGSVSNTIVLDFDGQTGHDTLRDLEATYGELPPTVRALTPGGGLHFLLRHPGRRVPTRKNVLPGMDVRGDGGFIVAHPSVHANGRRYEWDCDYHPEDMTIADAPPWVVDLVCGDVTADSTQTAVIHTLRSSSLGMAQEVVTDGREAYMRDTILAVLREMRDELRRLPSADELFNIVWPQYSRKVDFSRPGRGADEVKRKCEYTLKRVTSGLVAGVRPEPETKPTEPIQTATEANSSAQPESSSPDIFLTLGINDLMSLPPVEWMLKDTLTRNGFSILYGPPASLKTFLCLDMALCIAGGLPWKGRTTSQCGVLYVAAEGAPGIKKRITAWQTKNRMSGVDLPFRLLPTSVNMTEPDQVQKLIRTALAAASLEGCPIGLVVIDTLARSIPGADENSAQDMGRFVAAVEAIKAGIACHVMGVHHSGKDAERGARGSSALLGAVDTMIQVKRDDTRLTVTVEKQKDDEEAKPIQLTIEMVEWMEGLQVVKSIVLNEAAAPDSHAASGQDFSSIHRQIAAAIGPNGRMASRRVAQAIGITSGNKRDEMNQSIPFYPSYVEVTLPDGKCHLMRTRETEAATSPHLIVRTEIT
jgi:hypothetical protein